VASEDGDDSLTLWRRSVKTKGVEMSKQMLAKPLVVLVLILQCAFLVYTLASAPKENGQLHAALSSLRTPSQSNIAPINQNDARELRVVLEQLISNRKSFMMASVIFSFVSIASMVTMFVPFGFKRTEETQEMEGRLKIVD
jgi:hypothetical protein